MLNKIRKNILPMLDTLGDALTQYLAQPSDELFYGIIQFVDAINASLASESKDVDTLSKQIKASLENPVLSEVERLYNEYCITIENLPVQYKVVFLPYYDNTWDALASAYEAFTNDPNFVTEIVIIPIRRNTPTGLKMVYEDYLTPKGVPNTPFAQYSFEEDLPDFVFYNNPYDGVNIEKFQSHNIKPYAGCMVYVPYFLYQHAFHDKTKLEEETQQFTLLPGHDSADVFVVQGKSFLKTFSKRSRNGKKMVALGNPKTDNIYKNIQNYTRYPEWDKVTENKTVFLLNTHYSAAVTNTYKCFLPYLLEFIENNDDLALIWRPHPQSFLMFNENDDSQRYMDWKSYLDRIISNERMILDRTASDVSAIMYCDAVISYPSSVVAESIFADKPVYILMTDAREEVPPDIRENMTIEDYTKKLEQVRKYDKKNLFLLSAVHYIGMTHPVPKEEVTNQYWWKVPMLEFVENIRNGVDDKKELRNLFREQLFVNRDGTCGQKIHDYIVNLIENNVNGINGI